MSLRSWNACALCALATAPWPAFAGVSRGVGAPTVVAIANGYVISPSLPASDGSASPSAGHRLFALPVRVGNQTFPSMPGEFGAYDPPISARLARWSPGGSSVACTASTLSHAGAIVVIERGSCSFSTKIRNAQAAGAVGVVIIDNQSGDPTVMAPDGTANQPTLPAVMVSQSDGAAIKRCAGLAANIDGSAPAAFPAPAVAASGGDLSNPMNVGGGVLALAAATNRSATVDPATFPFPKAEPVSGARTISVTVTNPTEATRTYAASIALTAVAKEEVGAASVTVEPSSLTLAPGESAELLVTVNAGKATPAGPHWGRLTVIPDAGSALAAPFWFAVRTYTDAGPLQ
jgi:hypothetical protein